MLKIIQTMQVTPTEKEEQISIPGTQRHTFCQFQSLSQPVSLQVLMRTRRGRTPIVMRGNCLFNLANNEPVLKSNARQIDIKYRSISMGYISNICVTYIQKIRHYLQLVGKIKLTSYSRTDYEIGLEICGFLQHIRVAPSVQS